ncbi:hypothetical protein [Paenibacillus sp. GCM10027626]|uniref:hypothetical protein n=1 Tax=Paenibacillus sp. GCM10027626 TaxID=3273411 RepID=UPI00362BB3BD
MFRQLSRRLILACMLTTLIGVTIASAVSYYFSTYLIRSEFSNIAANFYNTSASNLTRYLTYTEETLKVISNHPSVATAISSPEYMPDVIEVLNGMVYKLNMDLRGATIYTLQGYSYTPTNYSDIPTLEQLRANAEFEQFYTNPSAHSIWIYRDGKDLSYYSQKYATTGIFSYVLKIPEHTQQPSAIMIADMDAMRLEQYFESSNALFQHAETTIGRANRFSSTADAATPTISRSSTHIIIRNSVHESNIDLTLSVPMANAKQPMRELSLTIGLLAAVSIVLAFFTFRRLRDSIVKPLAKLYKNMRQFSSSA